MKKLIVFCLLAFALTQTGFSQIYGGAGKLNRTVTSYFATQGNYLLALDSYNSFVPATLTNKSVSSTPLTSNYLSLDYAVADFLLFTGSINVFQMNQFVDETSAGIGPVSMIFKFGNIEFMETALKTGIMLSTTFSVGKQTNVLFNPYYSGALEFGIWSYWSYYFNTELPSQGQSVHLNLGVVTHNENQLNISNNNTPYIIPGGAVGVKYALGYQVPFGPWKLNTELWGEQFMRQPDEIIYSRESYAYGNIGGMYRFDLWEIKFSADVLLLGYTEETNFTKGAPFGYPKPTTEDINYAPFFINLGFGLNFSDIVNSWMGYETAIYNYDRVAVEDYNETLRRDDILTKLELEFYRDLYACFRAAKRYDESLQGSIYLDFTVNEDGTVSDEKIIVSTFDSAYTPQLEECMMLQVRNWEFPKGKKPMRFEIVPFNFK